MVLLVKIRQITNDVIRYYDECQQEFNLITRFFKAKEGLAIHFGFRGPHIKNHSDSLINMNNVLANKVKIKSADIILDAGCGIGDSSIWIAKNFGARVIGITISKKQVRKAKNLAKKYKVSQLVNFYKKDYTDTKFNKNSFDVVWGLESICYANDKKDFVQEAYRILKPGGRLIIADAFLTRKKYSQIEKRLMNKWLDGWFIPNLSEISQFKKHLKDMEFQKIQFSNIKNNVMPSSIRIYKLSLLGVIVWKFLRILGLKSKIQVNHITAGIYQHKTLKSDLWAYGIFYAEK